MNEFGHTTKPPVFAKQYYYLASPYTHTSEVIREDRAIAACRAMVWLTERRYHAYSPILQGHAMWHEKPSLPYTHEYWKQVNEIFVSKSAGVIVLTLPAWELSKGIASEIAFAQSLNLPIYKLSPKSGSHGFVD